MGEIHHRHIVHRICSGGIDNGADKAILRITEHKKSPPEGERKYTNLFHLIKSIARKTRVHHLRVLAPSISSIALKQRGHIYREIGDAIGLLEIGSVQNDGGCDLLGIFPTVFSQ